MFCDRCKKQASTLYRIDKRTNSHINDVLWNDRDHIRGGIRQNAIRICANCISTSPLKKD